MGARSLCSEVVKLRRLHLTDIGRGRYTGWECDRSWIFINWSWHYDHEFFDRVAYPDLPISYYRFECNPDVSWISEVLYMMWEGLKCPSVLFAFPWRFNWAVQRCWRISSRVHVRISSVFLVKLLTFTLKVNWIRIFWGMNEITIIWKQKRFTTQGH